MRAELSMLLTSRFCLIVGTHKPRFSAFLSRKPLHSAPLTWHGLPQRAFPLPRRSPLANLRASERFAQHPQAIITSCMNSPCNAPTQSATSLSVRGSRRGALDFRVHCVKISAAPPLRVARGFAVARATQRSVLTSIRRSCSGAINDIGPRSTFLNARACQCIARMS